MADVSGKRSLGQRENQEDAYAILAQSEEDASSDLLMIVSDGMGGHIGGEVASNLVISTFQEHFVSGSTAQNPRDRLLESAHAANAAVKTRIKSEPALKGMGCTLVAGLKMNDKLVWISIGDSHVYLYRAGALKHLNADHSVYGELLELVKAGKITQAEAKAHPRRNALRSAIIGTELALIDINAIDLQHGDLIVLATDGLDSLPNDKIAALLNGAARADTKTISEGLLTAVEAVGRSKQDNTTIVAYRHSETNRSTWSPDSKWGWATGPKRQIPSSFRKAALLVTGLCFLAVVVGLLAFRSGPEPVAPVVTKTTPAPAPIEQTIGGGEASTAAPDGPPDAPVEPEEGEGSGIEGNTTDDPAKTPDTSTELGAQLPVELEQ